MKLIATSDLHLGRHSSLPFDAGDGIPTAAADTWHRMVDYAVREDADALLLAGDLVDQANRYYEAAGELEKGLRRLAENRIPAIMVSGNHDHDALPELVDRLDDAMKPFVHLLGRDGTWETKVVTVRNGGKLQVTGWSYPEYQSRYSRNPMEQFVRPDGNRGMVSAGLLHCDVNQSNSVYAPVSTADFDLTGMDYWVLGHIHKPSVWRTSSPAVFYPGAPHPFDAGESDAGFMTVIHVGSGNGMDDISEKSGAAVGKRIPGSELTMVPVSPIRYMTFTYDVPDAADVQIYGDFRRSLHEMAADPAVHHDALQLMVLTVRCRGKADALQRFLEAHQEHKEELLHISDTLKVMVRRWIEEPQIEADLEKLSSNSDPAGLLASWILQIDKGRHSPELEELLDACRTDARGLNGHRVFQPLRESPDYGAESVTADYGAESVAAEYDAGIGTGNNDAGIGTGNNDAGRSSADYESGSGSGDQESTTNSSDVENAIGSASGPIAFDPVIERFRSRAMGLLHTLLKQVEDRS